MRLTHAECLTHLEKLRWNGTPVCPYCESNRSSPIKGEFRYHCNACFTSYSVTVKTMFHRTRLSLDKWFQAIYLISKSEEKISIRKLASAIQVNKNSASVMRSRIYRSLEEEPKLLKSITKFVEESHKTKDES
ncbi:transposase [Leptolyngbya sp. Heron Island J]|uniref:transposase n=1 Tax=Leptolyngbya sp. Heron Island J TaxID=1385935 RepID=UPI0004CFCA2C